jgi:hypothetical protein
MATARSGSRRGKKSRGVPVTEITKVIKKEMGKFDLEGKVKEIQLTRETVLFGRIPSELPSSVEEAQAKYHVTIKCEGTELKPDMPVTVKGPYSKVMAFCLDYHRA